MKRALGVGFATVLLSSACGSLHHEVRTERGETLRRFERKNVTPNAGVAAVLEVSYPELRVHFNGYDGCRTESVEEYPETTVDDATSPAAGPALATGIVTTLIGGVLLASRGAFSNAPNRRVIDETGRYGYPARTGATVWGVVGLGVGVPGLITGGVQFLQQGSRTTQRTKEEVVRTQDSACHVVPLEGEVLLVGTGREPPPLHTAGGMVKLTAAQMLATPFSGFIAAGRNVLLSAEQESELSSFEACARLLEAPAKPTAPLPRGALKERRTLAAACNRLPGAPAKALGDEAERLLQKEDGAALAAEADAPGAVPATSFEDALTQNPPRLVLEPGSPDLAKLPPPGALSLDPGTEADVPVLVRGVLMQRVEANIVVVDVGEQPLLMMLPSEAGFAVDFSVGSRVEAVGVWRGNQKLGGLTAPLVRTLWMRRAPGSS